MLEFTLISTECSKMYKLSWSQLTPLFVTRLKSTSYQIDVSPPWKSSPTFQSVSNPSIIFVGKANATAFITRKIKKSISIRKREDFTDNALFLILLGNTQKKKGTNDDRRFIFHKHDSFFTMKYLTQFIKIYFTLRTHK